MTRSQEALVKRIVLGHLSGVPKDTEPHEIEEKRWGIHAEMFEHELLEDISAVDLTDEADQVISEEGWRL